MDGCPQLKRLNFFLKCHHIIFDGITYRTLLDDISAAYNGKEISLENYNSIDFDNNEVNAQTQPILRDASNWYEKTCSGLEVEALPIPEKDDEKISFDIFNKNLALDYQTLKSFCKTNKISASALTSTAFTIVTDTYNHQQESLFSMIYHGRNDRTKHIDDMFIKTLPVYCRWKSDKKVDEFLCEITKQVKSARDNDLFSYADFNQICPMNNAPMFISRLD